MKAIVYTQYGPPEVLQLKEVSTPTPKDNEVLIRIHAVTVGSVDCTFRSGKPFIARMATGLFKPKKTILGTNLSGKITAVGKSVKKFKEGDEVFAASDKIFSAYAEYICLPEEGTLALKPSQLSHSEAAGIYGGVLTALPFLKEGAKLQPGQKILINGASGSVGTAAVQLAKYLGAEVTAVCSTANLELVSSLGADRTIDYTKEDFTREAGRYDIIFDAVGKSSFMKAKKALKPTGIYLSTVLSFGIVFQMLRSSIAGNKKAKIMFTGLRPSKEKNKDLEFLGELVEKKKIRSVLDKFYPFEQIAEAHRYVEKGHKKGNVALAVGVV